RAVIDATNIVATEFYNAIGLDKTQNFTSTILDSLTPPQEMGIGKMIGVFGGDPSNRELDNKPFLPGQTDAFSIIGNGVGAIFVILSISFTFLMGSVLFAYRILSLIFLMALSSLAFLASIVPRAETYYGRFWNNLIDNALFAPIYLFLPYFVFKIMVALGPATTFATAAPTTYLPLLPFNVNANQPAALAFYYFFILGLLNGALMIATTLSSEGAGVAQSVATKAMGVLKSPYVGTARLAGRLGAAAGGAAARGTLGAGARALANNQTLRDFASGSGTGFAGRAGRFVGTPNASSVRAAIERVGSEGFGQGAQTAAATAALAGATTGAATREEGIGRQLSTLLGMDEHTRQEAYNKMSDRQKIALETHINNPLNAPPP
ncbi:MAG: hypothetical protein AAB538_01290, partial [Patescibacteria group bacterium]